jgi:hypothetical protein
VKRPFARAPFLAVPSLALALALALAGGRPARAEDPPEWKPPEHSSAEMAFEAEAMPKDVELLPEGARPAEASDKAITEGVEAVAAEAKVPAAERTLALRTVKFLDVKQFATFGLVDLWIEPGAFPAALEAKAKEKGWAFRPMGSPARLLVVCAPEAVRERAVALQVRVAALRVAEAGTKALSSGARESAAALATTALELEPGLALGRLVRAFLAVPQRKPSEPKPAPGAYDAALAEFKASLDPAAPVPLDDPRRAVAKFEMGSVLLTRGGSDEVARDLLQEGIAEGTKLAFAAERLHGPRYNLACAHARLKDKAAAYAALGPLLEEIKDRPVRGLSDWWEKDPDFDSLHADPEWATLVRAYGEKKEGAAPPAPSDPGHDAPGMSDPPMDGEGMGDGA